MIGFIHRPVVDLHGISAERGRSKSCLRYRHDLQGVADRIVKLLPLSGMHC